MARKGRTRSSVKSACQVRSGKSASPAQSIGGQSAPVAIVGVGASAGGIEAFTAFLQAMPPGTGLGFVFIHHLSPNRESMLAEILSRATSLPVTEVSDEPIILPDHVYVVPPGQLMIVKGGALHLDAADGMQHRGVDRFFTSLARIRGSVQSG